jgi:DNA processing protein
VTVRARPLIELRPGEPDYPERLLDLSSVPDPLWLDGELPDTATPCVAIVGTRRMTPYGRQAAREIAFGLASAGVVIVSGLAQGIDSTAHEAALEARGRTVAVLGEGLLAYDRFGPERRRQLARAIRDHGALVSEYPLDLGAQHWTFPRRNATIAALADAVVVVEAPRGSGALITAKEAIALHRPIFAVPGPIGAPTWLGSNNAIQDGMARIIFGPAPVAAELGVSLPTLGVETAAGAIGGRAIELLASGATHPDELAAELGISGEAAATLIADLLLAGEIVSTSDGRFARR